MEHGFFSPQRKLITAKIPKRKVFFFMSYRTCRIAEINNNE